MLPVAQDLSCPTLPSADRREQANLIAIGQGVGIIPGNAVDKRDPHVISGQAQMLDQLPHRRPVREFHIHPLADSQFGVIPSQSGENFDVDPDHQRSISSYAAPQGASALRESRMSPSRRRTLAGVTRRIRRHCRCAHRRNAFQGLRRWLSAIAHRRNS